VQHAAALTLQETRENCETYFQQGIKNSGCKAKAKIVYNSDWLGKDEF